MKYLFSLMLCCLLAHPLQAQTGASALIPMPNELTPNDSKPFRITSGKTAVYTASAELTPSAKALCDIIKNRMGIELTSSESARSSIRLSIDTTWKEPERYTIEIDRKQLRITGASAAAVFYGVMTLDQWLLGNTCTTSHREIAPISITDAPRFGYRALMLDPARNFLPLADVKLFIDQMARYKYNVLQLHLTDDQGWRIAIRKHPRLASRKCYSQDDIRELIRYAAERYIEIVPEIDIPGHTASFLSVYPELGCRHLRETPILLGKTTNRMLCAANEAVYPVFADIIEEIAALFPSPRIHLGGDEATIPANWELCEDCKALMKQYGYTRPSQLMTPFFDKILAQVRKNGKTPILWCELNNIYPPADNYLFPYPQDVTLVSWRGGLTPTCKELTRRNGHPLIMAPGEFAYLDYPQLKGDLPEFDNWGMPVTTLERCYAFDPGYGGRPEEVKHILGIMGTLWGEAIKDINRATYMAFPRALALAEAGWTQMENRSWESFKQRLYPNLSDLMRRGISVRVPFEIVDRQVRTNEKNGE